MKILLVTYEYPPDRGGIASYLGGLCRALPEVKVVKLRQPKLSFAWLLQLPRIWQAARQADLVLVSHLLPLGTAARLCGKPYAVIVHGLDIRLARRKKRLASRVLKKAKLVVANSRSTASELRDFGLSESEVLVLTPAVDTAWEAHASLPGPRNAWKTILAAGRFVPRKGLDRLIGMLPKLRESCGEVRLVLAGAGPEEKALRERAEASGMAPYVTFVIAPNPEALATQYRACDLFALPVRESENDVEGFGIVFLEAALFGKPVVGMRTGGTPEAVEDGVTGLLADPNSERDFMEKIILVLNDAALAERLGAAGRQRVLRDFQWKERAQALMKRLL